MKFLFVLALVGLALAGPLNQTFKNRFGVDHTKIGEGFIVGGTAAKAGDAPYQVSLQRSSHFCGGSIVSANWIVTAAHCVAGLSASALNIRYNTLTHNSGGQLIKASTIISHEKYDSYNIDNDIAIIKVATPMTLGQTNAQAIKLPAQGSDPAAGANAYITGWGTTREGSSSLPTALQAVNVPVVARATCDAAYGAGSITANMFCAGDYNNGGKDACQGDSGGPVVINGELVGAVSWGYGCARPKYPGVYTRVGNYIDWMRQKGLA